MKWRGMIMVGLVGCGAPPAPVAPAPSPVAEPVAIDLLAPDATFEGEAVRAFVPDDPVGLVFVFHGTGAGIGFTGRWATEQVLQALGAARYAWVATTSTDRSADGQWDTHTLAPQANRDVPRLFRLVGTLVQQTALKHDTPWFTMGMSNGGAMATTFAHIARREGLPIAAVATYAGPVDKAVRDDGGPLVPSFVVVMDDDEIVATPRLVAGWQQVASEGLAVELRRAAPHGVTAAALADRTALDLATATAVLDDLVSRGLVDGQGMRRGEEDAVMQAIRALPVADNDVLRRAIKDVFREAWALHTMTGRFAADQVAFFETVRVGQAP